MPVRQLSRRALAVASLALAVVALPLGVLASHDFADVPNSNIFHADISALAASGVTSGCGGGNYCPSANVTREQMAAFLNRLGALAVGKTPVVNAAELGGLTPDQFARSDVPVTGHFPCSAWAMAPTTSGVEYFTGTNGRSVTTGSGTFACNVTLPDGAVISALRATVFDNHATATVGCALQNISNLGVHTLMASTGFTGEASTPLLTTLETTDITQPTVDNTQFAYHSICHLSGGAAEVRLYALWVEYQTSGLPII